MDKIREIINALTPQCVVNQVKLYKIKQFQSRYPKVLNRLRNKKKIKVAFLLIHSSVWKYDRLFQLMLEDDQFDPIVVICPYTAYGKEIMIRDLKQAKEFVRSKNYPYAVSLNFETGKWLNVKRTIKPDIVFFTNPHHLTRNEYYIHNYPESLNCYVQYSFHVSYLNEMQYDQLFHNCLFRAYYETSIHLKMAAQYSKIKAGNVKITGYPGVDVFLDKNYKPSDPWKIKNRATKRIVWSPHHSIDNSETLSYSCFMQYAGLMPDLANKYKNRIQIAFKPHPILKAKLAKVWGKEKMESYYEQWKTGENVQLEESDYVDLFLTSDAIINDSGSFVAEYLFVDKRAAFTYNDENVANRFNEFGKIALSCYEKISDENDLLKFIENVINEKRDLKREIRKKFINDYLSQLGTSSASQNILTDLKNELV